MNRIHFNKFERLIYQTFLNTTYLYIFIWACKIIFIRVPAGDDGGGGL